MFSRDFIDNIKTKVSMLELARGYTNLREAGHRIWQGRCPHPKHQDLNASFVVWEESNSWCCMGCHQGQKDKSNFGSDCIAFSQWIENKTFQEAVRYLADYLGINIEEEKDFESIYKHNKILASSYNKNIGPAISYLFNRGISQEDINKWLIGFDGARIIFPLFDRYNNILGFSKRQFLNPNHPKYWNSPNSPVFQKKNYLYGLNHIDNNFKELRITEGVTDVILANKYGVKNITCSLGCSFNHIDIIKKLKMTPVFIFDGDEAGQKAIKKAINSLSSEGIHSKVVILPLNKDMADISNQYKDKTEDFIVKNTMTYSYYLVKDIMQQYNSKLCEFKLEILPEIKNILSGVDNKEEAAILKSFIKQSVGLEMI